MDYYLDYDTRQKCYYLAPFKVVKDEAYLIRFTKRFEADKYLKMLNSGSLKNPITNRNEFVLIEEVMDGLSRVKIFEIKKGPL